MYILVTTAKDGRSVTSLDRKIPLVTIKALSMSNLRDDWMVTFFARIFAPDLELQRVLGFALQHFGRGRPYLQHSVQNRAHDLFNAVDAR